jgi:hypothetical protein
MSVPSRSLEENMPTHRSAIRAIHGVRRVYLLRKKARRDYRCRECHSVLAQGAEHVLVRYLHPSKGGYDHHHVHWACARDRILPELLGIEEIPAAHAPRPRV